MSAHNVLDYLKGVIYNVVMDSSNLPRLGTQGLENKMYKFHQAANDIISSDTNSAVLVEFFKGVASSHYYDGNSYQLYFDRDDNSLSIHQEASDQSWIQRDDGSLVQIHSVSGYCDIPQNERYIEGSDISDFGYSEFVDMIETKIAEVL